MTVSFGPFSLRDDGLLFAGDHHVPLTPTEENVLRVLAAAGGRSVTKDELIESVWRGAAVSESSLTRAVHTLRRRLREVPGGEGAIATLYARGYRLALPVSQRENRPTSNRPPASPLWAPANEAQTL